MNKRNFFSRNLSGKYERAIEATSTGENQRHGTRRTTKHWKRIAHRLLNVRSVASMESEVMLEWSAEWATEITREAIDLELLSRMTNVDRGVQILEFVLQQLHTALMTLTSHEANDIAAKSRKNPLEACRSL